MPSEATLPANTRILVRRYGPLVRKAVKESEYVVYMWRTPDEPEGQVTGGYFCHRPTTHNLSRARNALILFTLEASAPLREGPSALDTSTVNYRMKVSAAGNGLNCGKGAPKCDFSGRRVRPERPSFTAISVGFERGARCGDGKADRSCVCRSQGQAAVYQGDGDAVAPDGFGRDGTRLPFRVPRLGERDDGLPT